MESFLKSIEGKDEIPDETLIKAFNDTFARSFGKYPKYKEAAGKLSLDRKMELMKNAAASMKKDPNRDTPVLQWEPSKKIWLSGAVKTAAAQGTKGNA